MTLTKIWFENDRIYGFTDEEGHFDQNLPRGIYIVNGEKVIKR